MSNFKKICEQATKRPWVATRGSIGQMHIESEHEHGWANNGWVIAEAFGDDPERTANARLLTIASNNVEELVKALREQLCAGCNLRLAFEGKRRYDCVECRDERALLAKIEKEAAE